MTLKQLLGKHPTGLVHVRQGSAVYLASRFAQTLRDEVLQSNVTIWHESQSFLVASYEVYGHAIPFVLYTDGFAHPAGTDHLIEELIQRQNEEVRR